MNLNPVAPAQSKRTFAFSGKTRNVIGNASISTAFFCSCLQIVRAFSRKVEKRVQGAAPEPYKYTKIDSKGAQKEPKNQQTEPQGPTKYEKHATLSTTSGKVEPQVLQWNPRAPTKCKKNTITFPKVLVIHENVPQSAEKHTSTQTQTTNQRTNQPRGKQRETRTGKQPNE